MPPGTVKDESSFIWSPIATRQLSVAASSETSRMARRGSEIQSALAIQHGMARRRAKQLAVLSAERSDRAKAALREIADHTKRRADACRWFMHERPMQNDPEVGSGCEFTSSFAQLMLGQATCSAQRSRPGPQARRPGRRHPYLEQGFGRDHLGMRLGWRTWMTEHQCTASPLCVHGYGRL